MGLIVYSAEYIWALPGEYDERHVQIAVAFYYRRLR